jgi:two-component system, OmpR family, alkaline phosphatase synthesis response regulator PhoP
MTKILVIEDQRDLAMGLRTNLEVEGYEVDVAHTGELGLQLARTGGPSLILLDIMLPDIEGFDVLDRLRREGVNTPVLILTARGEEVEKVRGFRLGADDYVTKPFGVMELLVRIEAILRRSSGTPADHGGRLRRGAGASSDVAPAAGVTVGESVADARDEAAVVLRFGDVEVDQEDHRVRRAGQNVALTPKAFDLLLALIRKDGRVATRVELLRDVWGYSAAVTTRTVDTHIAELRRRLEENPAEPRHILTVWKVGYRLQR